jgi:Skp family chaperone for outer membrane proteins
MATTNIELDIENITGVSDANDQFIISAQKFVVSSVPKNLLHFAQKASSASTDGSAISFSVNDSVMDVQRNGYSCREIPMSEGIWALDSTSLKYATAKHPVWFHKQGAVHFAPVTDGSNAGYVFYVDYSLIDDNSDLRNAVIFRASSSEFSKLSSAQLPTSAISFYSVPPDTPSLATVSYSGPGGDKDATSPTFTTATLAASSVYTGSAPAYTKPTITKVAFKAFYDDTSNANPFGDNDPGAFSISAVTPVQPDIPNFTFSVTTSLPSYTSPKVGGATEGLSDAMTALTGGVYGADADFLDFSKWFTVAGEFIEDEEDSELAAVQLNKISTYISAYSQDMQDKLNSFNTDLQKYQAELQKELQEAQYEQQAEHQSSLQQYQAEVGAYSADVNKEVQEYQQKLSRYSNELNMAFQSWSKTESDNISVFQADISNELNEYNKELALYQTAVQESMQEIQVANQVNIAQAQSDLQVAIGNEDRSQQRLLQNAVNEMQEIINNNNNLLQKYQSETSVFSAEVNKEIQEYQTKVQISQKYGMEAEKYYKWAQSEVSSYVQNNSKMLATMMASQSQQKAK